MHHLEVSGAVRPIYGSLDVKRLMPTHRRTRYTPLLTTSKNTSYFMKVTRRNADSTYYFLFDCLILEGEIEILSRKVGN